MDLALACSSGLFIKKVPIYHILIFKFRKLRDNFYKRENVLVEDHISNNKELMSFEVINFPSFFTKGYPRNKHLLLLDATYFSIYFVKSIKS